MTPEEVELSEVHSKEATTTTTFSHGSNSTDSNFIQEHIDSFFLRIISAVISF